MQQSNKLFATNQPVTMPLIEITEILVKHYGLHEGLYDLAFEFQIAVGAVGPQPSSVIPGAMIGVSRVGLAKSPQAGPNTVDAAKINPIKPPAKKPKVAAK